MPPHQSELLARCHAGDTAAFSPLYQEHVQAIFAYFSYRTPTREVAEDLTSNTFLRALTKINHCKALESSFRPWLFTIARHELIRYLRSTRSVLELRDTDSPPTGPTLESTTDHSMQVSAIRSYIDNLPDKQRDILLLRLWDDLPYSEISHITGQSVSNCKVIVSRGLSLLRLELGHLITIFILLVTHSS